MTDVHTKERRSYNMSQIRAKDTKPEILVRKFLFSKSLRYRLHDKGLSGTPDLRFPKYKKVVFIHGCYRHGHDGCIYFAPTKTRTEWWMDKINDNKKRDKRNQNEHKKIGWDPIVIWECELKKEKRDKTFNTLLKVLEN